MARSELRYYKTNDGVWITCKDDPECNWSENLGHYASAEQAILTWAQHLRDIHGGARLAQVAPKEG